MSRSSVKVCIRTRPTHQFAQDNIILENDEKTVHIHNKSHDASAAAESTMLNNKQNSFKFTFNHIFHNATQLSIYNMFASDTVQGVIDGINGAIMTYGQTGSGKTFTMMGDTHNYEHRGIAPRSISHLFNEINSRIEIEYIVTCSYIELYGEKIYDLLADFSNVGHAGEFTIAEEKDGRGVHVRGVKEVVVKSENEALNLLFTGELSKTTAQHKLNRRSNRSHSIFTVYLQQRQRSGISERVVHSKLHLVDLAGSERLKKTLDGPDGYDYDEVTKRESMTINQSLTFLEQCVVSLSRKGHQHIPYRQCKLTNILKDALGANCNTLMIACIWGESAHLEETVSTLRLAARMMKVQNETSKIETVDSSTLIKRQAKLIKALKQELLMHDALVERAGVGYDPFTPEQQSAIRSMIEKYIDAPEVDEEDVLNIDSYRKVIEVCKQFKKIVLLTREELKRAKEDALAGFADSQFLNSSIRATSSHGGDLAGDAKSSNQQNITYVGEDAGSKHGFSLGVAPTDSYPQTAGGVNTISFQADAKNETSGRANAHSKKSVDFDKTSSQTASSGLTSSAKEPGPKPTKAMEVFCSTDGAELNEKLMNAKATLKEYKAKYKELSQKVNSTKLKIDEYQQEIERRKISRIQLLKSSGFKPSETEDIIDEEEFNLMKELKETKRTYKNAYEQFQKVSSVLSQVQANAERLRDEFAEEFAMWNVSYQTRSMLQAKGLGADDELGFTNKKGDSADQLDDQEEFERLEVERVMAKDPDSLAFFNANKTRKAHMTQSGTAIKQIHKSKRLM